MLTILVGVHFDQKNQQKRLIKINPLSGGLESKDFSSLVLKIVEKYLTRKKITYKIIQNTDFSIEVEFISEKNIFKNFFGIFKLVRISPFGKNDKTHTSFCKVTVNKFAEKSEIKILDSDLKWDFFKSTGPGGQHKNKTLTAVRLTHVPTGVVVISSNERSQLDNKKNALEQLKIELDKQDEMETLSIQKDKWQNSIIPKDANISFYFNHNFIVNEINGKKVHKIKNILNGELEELIE
jgi:peptide chain release factor 2